MQYQDFIWPALIFYAINILWIVEPWWSRAKRNVQGLGLNIDCYSTILIVGIAAALGIIIFISL